MKEFIHNDFSIGLPNRWIDTSIIAVAGPPDRGFSPSITITREKLEFRFTLNEYAVNQLMVLEGELAENDYKVLDEGPMQLNDIAAYQRTHEFEVNEDVRARQMQVYVIKDEEAITITCTSTDEGFDDSKALFLEAVRQFKWK